MRKVILLSTLIVAVTSSYSQSTLLWSEDFIAGMTYYYSDQPSVKIDFDTIIVTGRQNTPNGQRLLVVKYDMNGNIISTVTYGNDSVFNSNSTLVDYKFDAFNHVYLLHKEMLGFYKSKIVLQKYSLDGTLIWIEQIQNAADTSFAPRSLALANDTCLFMTAYKEYDYPAPGDDVIMTTSLPYLYLYHTNGNQLWQRQFNLNTELYWFAFDIFSHNNTAFLFANSSLFVSRLVKVDINNNMTINPNTGLLSGINNVQSTPDNNLLITAALTYRISKTDLNGSVIWTENYGTYLPSNMCCDEIAATTQDANGNIYVSGRHYGPNYGGPAFTNADILTIKYNSSGNLVWQNRFIYGTNNADIGNYLRLKNGNVYVGGQSQHLGIATDYDYVVVKIDSASGATSGLYRYNGITNGDDAVSSVAVFDDGKVALTGLSYMNSHYDWTTQLLSDVILYVQDFEPDENFEVYPSPAAGEEILTVNAKSFSEYLIVTPLGQIVQTGKLNSDSPSSIKLNSLTAGLYFLQLKNERKLSAKKFIVK